MASAIQPSAAGDVGRGPSPPGAALQEDEERQVVVRVLGRGEHAVEEPERFRRAWDGVGKGAGAHGEAHREERRLEAAPIERHVDGVVLHIQAGYVIACELCHGAPYRRAARPVRAAIVSI